MSQARHLGVFVPPFLAALVIAALATMWATGTQMPWLAAVLFVAGLVILGFAFLDMLVRDIRRSHLHPIGLRAAVLGVMVLEALLLFASTYLLIADVPGEMTGLRTPLDAVYFTMTTIMTIGFGDIAAEGQIARGAVLTQMFFTVVLLTASVRLLSSLVRSVAREEGHLEPGERD
jgi:voltage-gated potassium channel